MAYRYYIQRPTGLNFEKVESVSTPNFKELRKRGRALPVHPHLRHIHRENCPVSTTYNGERNEMQASPFSVLSTCETGMGSGYASWDASPIGRPLWQLQADATNRLLEKCRGTKIDLGVALGETRETADMIGSSARKIASSALDVASSTLQSNRKDAEYFATRAFRTLTGGKIDKIRQVADLASSAWLGWSYGVKPLLTDIYAAIDTVKGADKQPYYELETVRTRLSDNLYKEFSHSSPNGYGGTNTFTHTHDSSRIVSGNMTFVCNNPVLRSLDQVGLTNPLSVAYELVTLSFVLDWFIPVGDFIQNIVPPLGVDFVRGTVTTRCIGTSWQSTSIVPTSPSDPGWLTQGEVFEDFKERIVLDDIPAHKPYIPDVSLSLSQAASGLALLWSLGASPLMQKSGALSR